MYDYAMNVEEKLLWRAIYFKLVFDDENYPIFFLLLLMLADQLFVLTVAVAAAAMDIFQHYFCDNYN